MREHDFADARPRRRRFDDDEPPVTTRRGRRPEPSAAEDDVRVDVPDHGDRWTTWDAPGTVHGPQPHPDWVITELAAVDVDLGVLKTGKEADVHLLERRVPGTDRSCLLAAKRYRDAEHRMFHRDAGYLEGRRVRRSRETRAMAGRTAFGREMIAGQWAMYEFAALDRLWRLGAEIGGIVVPYPVQVTGTELLLEFVGEPDGTAAPRLAQLRPEPDALTELFKRLVEALMVMARLGLAHGDLSPYNILVRDGQPVLIDLPQVVDIVANPQGPRLLARDVGVVTTWFAARGLPVELADPQALTEDLLAEAGLA